MLHPPSSLLHKTHARNETADYEPPARARAPAPMLSCPLRLWGIPPICNIQNSQQKILSYGHGKIKKMVGDIHLSLLCRSDLPMKGRKNLVNQYACLLHACVRFQRREKFERRMCVACTGMATTWLACIVVRVRWEDGGTEPVAGRMGEEPFRDFGRGRKWVRPVRQPIRCARNSITPTLALRPSQ